VDGPLRERPRPPPPPPPPVDPQILPELPTSPENAAKRAIVIDYGYWAEHYDEVTKRFNEWLAS